MTRKMAMAVAGLVSTLAFVVPTLQAVEVEMEFAQPEKEGTVKITFHSRTSRWARVEVTIPAGSTASEKRDLIKAELEIDRTGEDPPGHPAFTVDSVGVAGLRIRNLPGNTRSVQFWLGETREGRDHVRVEPGESGTAIKASAKFEGYFIPFGDDGTTATFRAGFETDLGAVEAQVTAEELGFEPDGYRICEALYGQLAESASHYGVALVNEGEQLTFSFDSTAVGERGGVIVGNTSPSAGCGAEVEFDSGESCPEDIDGDGIVGLSDLAALLASYGTVEGETGYNPAADIDQSGTIDLSDLAALLAAYATEC